MADATIAPGGALDYHNEVVGRLGGETLARPSGSNAGRRRISWFAARYHGRTEVGKRAGHAFV